MPDLKAEESMEQLSLFNTPESPTGKAAKPGKVNPCLLVYDKGPENVTCADCVHLRYRPRQDGRKFWKCDLRRLTDSALSDHRKSWPACGRYGQRIEEYHGG